MSSSGRLVHVTRFTQATSLVSRSPPTAADLTKLRYYFELTTSPNVIWTDMATINLDAGQPVRVLDPNNIALSGDVSGKYMRRNLHRPSPRQRLLFRCEVLYAVHSL